MAYSLYLFIKNYLNPILLLSSNNREERLIIIYSLKEEGVTYYRL
jgi:hypothetical protein